MHHAHGLFQLGMDLEASTTQTEEINAVTPVPANDREQEDLDHFITRDGVEYAGTHLILDLIGAERLDDIDHIDAAMRRCVEASGATLLHIHLHRFTPTGVSGVAVLAESHISVHTWPERNYAAFDVFMCGDARPHEAVEVLREAFSPTRLVVSEHLRGRGA